MMRKGTVSVVAALVLAAGFSAAKADSVGTLGFADIGSPSVSPGTDINAATIFNIGNLNSTGSNSGVFAGIPSQGFGAVSFDTTNPTSLSFGNAVFGSFVSTSITQTSNSAGQVSYFILGDLTGGTYTGTLTPNPAPASFTISFTQTPAGTGAISDSATLAVPANTVPEPSAVMLVGLGVVSMGIVARRKRVTLAV